MCVFYLQPIARRDLLHLTMKSGADQLRDWIKRRFPGDSPQRDAAQHFGWQEKYISLLVNGRQAPALVNAVRIEQETGIPVEAWVSSAVDKQPISDPDDGTQTPVAAGGKRNV